MSAGDFSKLPAELNLAEAVFVERIKRQLERGDMPSSAEVELLIQIIEELTK